MKKMFTKPVLAALTLATVAGALTPVLAKADTNADAGAGTKVVMGTQAQDGVRYSFKDLRENNQALLQTLLKTQADHLYVVVDKIGLDAKLTDLMNDEEKWQDLLDNYYDDMVLEVRADQEDGFLKLEQETKDGVTYIKGKVTDDVTKVVVKAPNNEIQVENFVDHGFTVSFPAMTSSAPVYVTLKAYQGDKLVDTERVLINDGTVEDRNVVLYTTGVYLGEKAEVKVNGLVTTDADTVKVRYGDETKEVALKKLWNGVKAFSVTFHVEGTPSAKAVVEAYKDGNRIDTEDVDIVNLNAPDDSDLNVTIKGTAALNAPNKTVHVKGTVEISGDVVGKVKLMVVAPDGKRSEVKLDGNKSFEADLPYHDRSFSAKAVRVELYVDDKLAAQADIPYGVPQNHPVPPAKPEKPEKHGKHEEHEKWHVLPVKANVKVVWENEDDDEGKDTDKDWNKDKEKEKGKGERSEHHHGKHDD